MNFLPVLAMAVPPQTGEHTQMANPILAYAPLFISMFLIMYFLVIRPQKKQQAEREELLKNIKKGDKVVTSGGMIGTVVGINENQVVLKVGDNQTKLEFIRTAISYVMKDEK